MTPATSQDYLLRTDIAKAGHTVSRARTLFYINKGRVLGPDGSIVSPDNYLFSEFGYNKGYANDHAVFARRRFPKMKLLIGNYASLTYPMSQNYYHWITESLPNIKTLEKYLPILDGIFIPRPKEFHRESLSALGVYSDKLLALTHDSYYECEHLYVPSFQSGWALREWVPEWLRSSVLPREPNGRSRKIYISRNDSYWRKVVNEEEVIELLSAHGYESVELSKLSFFEQAQLFDSAISIIAVHGSGLANLVFCRAGVKILEIFPPGWTSLCYLHLARLIDSQYQYMIAEHIVPMGEDVSDKGEYRDVDKNGQGSDVRIPMDKLLEYIGSQDVRCTNAT